MITLHIYLCISTPTPSPVTVLCREPSLHVHGVYLSWRVGVQTRGLFLATLGVFLAPELTFRACMLGSLSPGEQRNSELTKSLLRHFWPVRTPDSVWLRVTKRFHSGVQTGEAVRVCIQCGLQGVVDVKNLLGCCLQGFKIRAE